MTGVLHVHRQGCGPALVLLHGFTGSGRSMAGLAQSFADEYETIAPDLPGHGRSVRPADAHCYDFTGCLDALVETLAACGHERAHWLGYSMGARLALGCAVRHPGRVQSLVLVSGRAGIADPLEREVRRRDDEALARRIETNGIDAFVDEWMAQPMFATQERLGPAFLAELRAQRLANDPAGLAASLRGLGVGAQPPLFDDLGRFTTPTLLVAGALDRKFVAIARELALRMPCAAVREIPSAGHAAHLEQPGAVVREVRDFLRRAGFPAQPGSTVSMKETAS